MANIDTTHLESGSAQRSAARPALLEGIQRINAMTDLTGAGYPMRINGGRISRVLQNGVYNLNPGRMSRWAAALARHRSGVGTAKLACVGDSTMAGVGSNPAASNTDIRRRAIPAVIAQIMTARYGVKASALGAHGDGWETTNFNVANPSVVRGAGWSSMTTMMVPGGWSHRDATTSLTPITFTPSATVATDRLDVWVVTYPGYADFVVSTGGTFNGSGATNAAAGGCKKYTISRTASTAPWVIQKSSSTPGAELIIMGMQAWSSADNPIHVWNMGAAGSKVFDWANPNEAWNAKNALASAEYAPDLTILMLTINDWAQGTSESLYKAALATLITSAQVTGDVLLVSGVPSNLATATTARQEEVTGWMLDMAEQYDCPAAVLAEFWVSQLYRPDRGYYFDGLHPTNVGYAHIAEVLTRIICEV